MIMSVSLFSLITTKNLVQLFIYTIVEGNISNCLQQMNMKPTFAFTCLLVDRFFFLGEELECTFRVQCRSLGQYLPGLSNKSRVI